MEKKISILVENETNWDISPWNDLIRKVVRTSLEHEGIHVDTEISMMFVDRERIMKLNNEYRGFGRETDVLSFPLFHNKEDINGSSDAHAPIPLGDIVLSLDKAKEQSEDYGHSLEREIGFLVAHSMLHLMGYDHSYEADEERMIQKQETILKKIGLER